LGRQLVEYLFELAPNTNTAALGKKFPAYLKKYMADNGKSYELFLTPLRDMHSKASDIGLDYVNYQKFDSKYTNIFSLIALIVLIIACINFMNFLPPVLRKGREKLVSGKRSVHTALNWVSSFSVKQYCCHSLH
jgi:putative ABC transport system permease protein